MGHILLEVKDDDSEALRSAYAEED